MKIQVVNENDIVTPEQGDMIQCGDTYAIIAYDANTQIYRLINLSNMRIWDEKSNTIEQVINHYFGNKKYKIHKANNLLLTIVNKD